MVHNTTLSSLYIECNDDITIEGIRPFYENPRSMNRLEMFLFGKEGNDGVDWAKKIAASLKDNWTLTNISHMDTLDRSERFYLDLNRRGRRYLYQEDDIVMQIWPHMLARVANGDEIHFLFSFLRERADLLSMRMVTPPFEKAKYM